LTSGVGVNLNNEAPTTSVLQLLRESDPACPPLSVETSLAATFNAIEELINQVETEGPEPFIQIYYSYWKHR
jgi:biotin-(acetyl-CoA carboxylase) ligase